MQTHHWVIVLMATLAAITLGMFISDLEPRERGRALAVVIMVTCLLLMAAGMVLLSLE